MGKAVDELGYEFDYGKIDDGTDDDTVIDVALRADNINWKRCNLFKYF